jgi:predicted nucleic acid-binding Zn ribbon protein
LNKVSDRPPETLNRLLTTLLRNLGIEKKVKEYEVINNWAKIVGPKISKVTIPERTENGILFVKVKSAAWKSELMFMKRDIMTTIDKTVGSGIVKDIRFL